MPATEDTPGGATHGVSPDFRALSVPFLGMGSRCWSLMARQAWGALQGSQPLTMPPLLLWGLASSQNSACGAEHRALSLLPGSVSALSSYCSPSQSFSHLKSEFFLLS